MANKANKAKKREFIIALGTAFMAARSGYFLTFRSEGLLHRLETTTLEEAMQKARQVQNRLDKGLSPSERLVWIYNESEPNRPVAIWCMGRAYSL